MSNKDNGGPAFPCENYGRYELGDGMTPRDYFAAKAMVGILSARPKGETFTMESVCSASYELADAMLQERDK